MVSSPALAEDVSDGLRVTLPEGCPSESHFRERLRALAAGRPVPSQGQVELAREGGGYRLRVETRDVSRTLWNASCAKLVESAAVIVALGAAAAEAEVSADMDAPVSSPEQEARPAPENDTQVAAGVAAAPPQEVKSKVGSEPVTRQSESPAAARRQPNFAGWAELSALWGVVPGVTVRPAVGVRLRGERLGGAISLDYALPRSSSGAEGVRVHGPGASALLTLRLHARVHAALGPDVHLLWGRGQGVDHVRTAMLPLWAGRAELVLVPWTRGMTELGIVVSGAVAFARHAFVFADGGTAYRPQSYQLLGGLRLALERKRR